jgi:hypothetical protein
MRKQWYHLRDGLEVLVGAIRSNVSQEQPYNQRVYDLGDRHGRRVRTIRSLLVGLSRKTTAALPCVDESPRHARRNLPDYSYSIEV